MPMIEVSEEEYERRRRGDVLDRLHDAVVRGDEAEERRLEREFAPSAEVLMRAKRVMGSAWLRRQAFDMRRAEAAYGRNWLDD